MAGLHNWHARELADLGLFLESLRSRFEDDACTQVAVKGDLVSLRQWGRVAKDYVQEFRKIVGKLRGWSKRLLVHQFHMGLDRDLWQACVYRGLGPSIAEWYKAAIELNVGLKEFHTRSEGPCQPCRMLERPLMGWGVVRPYVPTRTRAAKMANPMLPMQSGGSPSG